ncbi:MAG: type II secretion system protein N [Alphaproteobacteria bacterium]|nr:type II secretion system protein N [Alphaproteobacteria bacterium]
MILRGGLFLVFILGWLLALMPLKGVMLAAGGASAFGYQDVFGTIWSGRIYGLNLNGERVDEITVSLEPLPLVTGQLSADWRISDSSLRGSGHASWAGDRVTARDTALDVSVYRFGFGDIPGLTGDESVRISLLELDMRGDVCHRAVGDVRSDVLAQLAESYGFTGPVLEGMLTCIDERLALDLSGQSDALDLTGRVYFTRQGYEWDLQAETSQGELADVLSLMGLERDGAVWRHTGSAQYAR